MVAKVRFLPPVYAGTLPGITTRTRDLPNKTEKTMISLKDISRNKTKPPRIILYGPPGVGKTTAACMAPSPVVINIEDGLGELDVPSFPKAETYSDVMEALNELGREEHDYKTVVIDTLDWFENLVWDHTCKRLGVDSIEKPGYGRGYVEAVNDWLEFFNLINALRDEKGMVVIMTAHSQVTKFEDPLNVPYDTFGLKIHKRAAAKAEEYSDIIGFCNFKTLTKKDTDDRHRGISTGERVIHLVGSPAFTAKNRYSLPAEIPLTWEALENALTNKGTN